jgi:hypothetical protein
MAKRDPRDFDVFDRELAMQKPDLAARIGVLVTAEPHVVAEPSQPALRVVADPAPETTPRFEPVEEPSKKAPMKRRTSTPRPKVRGTVVRSDGSEAGRVIVYLPSDLALRLRRFCFEQGRAITDVAGDLLGEAIAASLPA